MWACQRNRDEEEDEASSSPRTLANLQLFVFANVSSGRDYDQCSALMSRDTGSLLLSNFYRIEPLKTCHVKFTLLRLTQRGAANSAFLRQSHCTSEIHDKASFPKSKSADPHITFCFSQH